MSVALATRRLFFSCLALAALAGCMHGPQMRDRRVVVLNFEAAQPNPKTQAIADWIKTGLSGYPRVAVIETRAIEPYLTASARDAHGLQTAGKKAGVDYLVLGSFSQLDRNFIVNARLLAVSTGEIVKGSSITRACEREEDLFPISQAIARVMAANLKFLAEQYDAQAGGR